MIELGTLVDRPAAWLASDQSPNAVVVSSRVRLARNLDGRSFRRSLGTTDQELLVAELLDDTRKVLDWSDGYAANLEDLDQTERKVLFERRLISREMMTGRHPGGVVITQDERASLMLNEEDHVRIQAVAPGFDLEGCLRQAVSIDRKLEKAIAWAVHGDFGYLTSCPTNTGTGLRASVMLHLPGLAESKDVVMALRGLSKLHLAVRGLQGEGSEARGHYYQISNQRTLGRNEGEITAELARVIDDLTSYEQMARAALMEKRPSQVEDRVFRAWGLLTSARRLTGKEVIDQLSWVRFGRALNLLSDVDWAAIDQVFIQGQAAHLEFLHPDAVDPNRRDEIRAELVREWLNSKT